MSGVEVDGASIGREGALPTYYLTVIQPAKGPGNGWGLYLNHRKPSDAIQPQLRVSSGDGKVITFEFANAEEALAAGEPIAREIVKERGFNPDDPADFQVYR